MESIQYVRVLRRRWYVVLVFGLVGAAAGWFTAPDGDVEAVDSVYLASHTLLASDDAGALGRTAFLVTVGEVPRRAADALGEEDPEALASEITVIADTSLGTIEIATIQSTPARARALADTFAEELVSHLIESTLASQQAATDAVLADLEALDGEINRLDDLVAISDDETVRAERDATVNRYRLAFERLQNLLAQGEPEPQFTTISPARAVETYRAALSERLAALRQRGNSGNNRQPAVLAFEGRDVSDDAPPEPEESLGAPGRAGAGGLLGLLVGTGVVLLADRLDTRVRSTRGAEAVFGVPVLGEIVEAGRRRRKAREVVFVHEPAGVAADGYRRLRTAIRMGRRPVVEVVPGVGPALTAGTSVAARWPRPPAVDGRAPVVLVTSAGAREGKTTVVANVAAAFAETGARVLAIDADLRRPELHRYLRPERAAPLARHMDSEGTTLDDVAVPTTVPGVWMLRLADDEFRAANPTVVFDELRILLDEARPLADVILLDTAPQLAVSDVDDLLPDADLVVLVARAGHTRQEAARRTSELLTRAGAPLLGVVLIGSEVDASSDVYFSDVRRTRRRRRLDPVVDFDEMPDRFSAFVRESPGPDQPLWRTGPAPVVVLENGTSRSPGSEPSPAGDAATEPFAGSTAISTALAVPPFPGGGGPRRWVRRSGPHDEP